MRSSALTVTLVGTVALLASEMLPVAPGSVLKHALGKEAPTADGGKDAVGKAVRQLADQLKRHPAKPATTVGHIGLYMIDLERRETTLIASEPEKGFDRCGSPSWSNDGQRIVYDTMPPDAVPLTLIKEISASKDGPTVRDLGLGNCPCFSANGDRIIFLNNSGQNQNGLWIMQADGSNRRKLEGYGRPKWSPDGHLFLIIGFDLPCTVTVIDDRPGRKSGQLEIAGKAVFRDPTWVEDGIIVAPIGSDSPEAIALLDVTQPDEAKVKEVLWTRGKELDVEPRYPLYFPTTNRVVFVGVDERRVGALYSFERGKNEPPKRLETMAHTGGVRDLAPSPDGHYVLFASDRGEVR
jgi:Tol biopolymer transport system component